MLRQKDMKISQFFINLKNWLLAPACYISKKGLEFSGFTLSWIMVAGIFVAAVGALQVTLLLATEPKKIAEGNRQASVIDLDKSTPASVPGAQDQSKKKSTSKKRGNGSGSSPGPGQPPTPASLSKQVAVYLPYWDQDNAFASLQAHSDKVSVVHPVWYTPESSGGIGQFSGAGNSAIINYSKSNSLKIIPSINNECDPIAIEQILADPNKINIHIQNIVSLVTSNSYDGIDIDYECFTNAGLKDVFSNFINSLSNEMHSRGRYLTAAVHAKTSDAGGWSGAAAQDWSAIGSSVDQLLLMTYDYHWDTSGAGDIAPISWLQAVLSYGKSRVSAAKILLGIHFYGYDWVGNNGADKTYNEVMAIIAAHSPSVQVSGEQEKYFVYNDGSDHTVFFADRDVVAPRVGLANTYGVAGIGIWRLGQEDSENWQKITEAFGG